MILTKHISMKALLLLHMVLISFLILQLLFLSVFIPLLFSVRVPISGNALFRAEGLRVNLCGGRPSGFCDVFHFYLLSHAILVSNFLILSLMVPGALRSSFTEFSGITKTNIKREVPHWPIIRSLTKTEHLKNVKVQSMNASGINTYEAQSSDILERTAFASVLSGSNGYSRILTTLIVQRQTFVLLHKLWWWNTCSYQAGLQITTWWNFQNPLYFRFHIGICQSCCCPGSPVICLNVMLKNYS